MCLSCYCFDNVTNSRQTRSGVVFCDTRRVYIPLEKNKQIATYYVLLPLSLPLEKFLGSEAERLASFSYCKLNVTTPVQLHPQPSCRVVLNFDKRENIRSVVFAAARAPTSNEHFSAVDSSPSPWASAWTCLLLSCGPFISAAFRNIFALRFVSSLARCSSSQRLKRLFRLISLRVPLSGPWPIENRVNDFSASRWRTVFSLQRSIERNDNAEKQSHVRRIAWNFVIPAEFRFPADRSNCFSAHLICFISCPRKCISFVTR